MVEYEFLTPFDQADEDGKYSKAINEALNKKEVTNIAISGCYGSGKTSVINTFQKNNPKWRFLDISLATFKNNKDNNQSKKHGIEQNILQQMFFKVNPSILTKSRFRRIIQTPQKLIRSITILILASVISYFFLFEVSKIKEIISFYPVNDDWWIKAIAIIILLVSAYLLIKKIIEFFDNVSFDKLNVKNLEISAAKSNNEESFLNKYLDEILYFFQQTEYNVATFQDLDRFNDVEIFSKLRELNNFINSSDQVEREVNFLYAIKDDMFDGLHNRTKFFDFIIPIIPYINPSNSCDKLNNLFKEQVQTKNIDKHFLNEVSLYIDDMRLLKNISNEYKIYNEKIGKGLDKNKLLAMVIYKNFFPDDFSNLHKNTGHVFNLFNEQDSHSKNRVNEITEKIALLREEIKTIERLPESNTLELRRIYLLELAKYFDSDFQGSFYIDGNNIHINDLATDENFEKLENAEKINIDNYNGGITFSEVENEIKADLTYKERQDIMSGTSKKTNKILKEISTLTNEKDNLKHESIKKLAKSSSNIFDKLDNIENKKLLVYLIKNGHIDEHYSEYISYPHEDTINTSDRKFLRSITDDIPLDFDYRLSNLVDILNKLSIVSFRKSSVLNYDLVDFLISKKSQYQEQSNLLFRQLSDNSFLSKSPEFLQKYLHRSRENDQILKIFAKEYIGVWRFIFVNNEFTNNDRCYFFEKFFKILSSHHDIVKLNVGNSIVEFAESLEKLPNLVSTQSDNFWTVAQELDIIFSNLKQINGNQELFEKIYQNDNYELNRILIQTIVFQFERNINIENVLNIAHLTTIIQSKNLENLQKRINNNIGEYVKNVFLKIDLNTQESENTIIGLLNNQELDVKLKNQIILFSKIKDINMVK